MPNRILHERICTSETLAALSAQQEVFFYRLLVQCDDYGRFDARPAVLRARCYPLQLEQVEADDVAGWLARLATLGLVQLYEVDGRPFLYVTTWDRYQQTRAKRSKFPPPPEPASNGNHMQADASNSAHMSPYSYSESNTRSEDEGDARARAQAADAAPPEPPPKITTLPADVVAAFTARGIQRYPQTRTEVQAARRLLEQGSAEDLAECWHDLLNGYGDDWDVKHRSFVMLERHNRFGNWLDWRDQGKPPPKARASPKANGQVSRQAFSGAELARQVQERYGV